MELGELQPNRALLAETDVIGNRQGAQFSRAPCSLLLWYSHFPLLLGASLFCFLSIIELLLLLRLLLFPLESPRL